MAQTRKQKRLGDVKKARRQRTIITIVIIVILSIGIVAAIVLLTPPNKPSPLLEKPISTAIYNQLTGVSNSTLQTIGSPTGITPLTPESGQLLLSGGKPEFLYIGADYCPYCAAERWSIIVALSRFGSFDGLVYMQSADSPEIFPSTSTFSFGSANFHANYNLTFVEVEEQHRDHSAFQTPLSQDQSALNAYDSSGSIPFIDIANKYVDNSGSQFSPGVLSGVNWTQIGSQLNNPSSSVAQAIDGAANTLIRAICSVDGGNPSSLCGVTLQPPAQASISATTVTPSNTLNIIASSDILSNETFRKGLAHSL